MNDCFLGYNQLKTARLTKMYPPDKRSIEEIREALREARRQIRKEKQNRKKKSGKR